jgi:hypothetical protein
MKIYQINNIFIFINWVLNNEEKKDILIIYPNKKKDYYKHIFKLANLDNINISSDKCLSKMNNIKNIYFIESELIVINKIINKIPKNSIFITYNFDLLYFSKCNIIHEYLSKLYYFSLLTRIKLLPLIENKFIKKPFNLDNINKNIYLLATLVENKILSKSKFNKLLVNNYKRKMCNICYQNKKTINSCCNIDICIDCLLNKDFKKCCPICKKYHKIKDNNSIIPKYLENYFEIYFKNNININSHIININNNNNNNNNNIQSINLYFDTTNFYFLNNKEINLYTII